MILSIIATNDNKQYEVYSLRHINSFIEIANENIFGMRQLLVCCVYILYKLSAVYK